VFTYLIGRLGVAALACQQVVLQYLFISMIIPLSFAQSSNILVSQKLGANDFVMARKIGNLSILSGLIVTIFFSLFFVGAPQFFASLFLQVSDSYLLIMAVVMQLFDCVRNITGGVLRAYYETSAVFFSSISAYWLLGMPLAYWLGEAKHYGPIGSYIGLTLGIALSAVMIFIYFLYKSTGGSYAIIHSNIH